MLESYGMIIKMLFQKIISDNTKVYRKFDLLKENENVDLEYGVFMRYKKNSQWFEHLNICMLEIFSILNKNLRLMKSCFMSISIFKDSSS